MAKASKPVEPTLDVDDKTAKGKGEGGWSPHPDVSNDEPAPFDPHSYRPNVEPPKLKPTGKKSPDR